MKGGITTWNLKADPEQFVSYMQDKERKRIVEPFPIQHGGKIMCFHVFGLNFI